MGSYWLSRGQLSRIQRAADGQLDLFIDDLRTEQVAASTREPKTAAYERAKGEAIRDTREPDTFMRRMQRVARKLRY